jgi:hypothetical protein
MNCGHQGKFAGQQLPELDLLVFLGITKEDIDNIITNLTFKQITNILILMLRLSQIGQLYLTVHCFWLPTKSASPRYLSRRPSFR